MTPEQKVRKRIDQQLTQCGWVVQDYEQMNIFGGLGVAVREFPLVSGTADYMLYVDRRAVGVVEAKPEGHTLAGVELQSGKYLDGLPANLSHFVLPLPFAYEATGEVTQFTNAMEPDARSRGVFCFHRPEELVRLVQLDEQTRSLLRGRPTLDTRGLWRVQEEAVRNLETSPAFRTSRPAYEVYFKAYDDRFLRRINKLTKAILMQNSCERG